MNTIDESTQNDNKTEEEIELKKIPRKTKQWAKEAYCSLQIAIAQFNDEYPSPTEDDKLTLLRDSVSSAVANREIWDKTVISFANEFVLDTFCEELQHGEGDEAIDYATFFIRGYIAAHISFGHIDNKKSDEVLHYINDNCDIPSL